MKTSFFSTLEKLYLRITALIKLTLNFEMWRFVKQLFSSNQVNRFNHIIEAI